jgi:hypothetical protein
MMMDKGFIAEAPTDEEEHPIDTGTLEPTF